MKHIALVATLFAATAACKKSPPQASPGSELPRAEQPAEPVVVADPAPAPAVAAEEEPADPWTAPAVAKDPLKRPLFWSAQKNGKTTYLLGTMHMGVDAEARLPDVVWQKLDAAPALAVETDTTDPAILGMGARKSGRLRDDLGPAYWKKLAAVVEPRVLEGLDRMKPSTAVAMLSMRGLPATPSMDGVLLARAQNQGKQIVYLEPATKQVALLDKWLDVRSLKMLLDSPDQGLDNTRKMLEAYLGGDESKLLALYHGQKQEALAQGITEREYEQSMEDMLYERNASWIPAIEKLHAKGNGFVAVGALHLVGKRSVIDLLAAKGYKVARVAP
jgi:uncharacterized protein